MLYKYEEIISNLCDFKNIDRASIKGTMKDGEFKNLVFLLILKFKLRSDKMYNELGIKSSRSFKYHLRKAYEKYLCDVRFREVYFTFEEHLEKNIK